MSAGKDFPFPSRAVVWMGLLVLATPLWAQTGDRPKTPEVFFAEQPQEAVVALSAQYTPSTDRQSGWLSITAHIKPTWHIYSITQPRGGPRPTEIKVQPSKVFRLLGPFQATPPADKKAEPAFDGLTVETHHKQVTWRVPIEIRSDVDPATLKIQGVVCVQPCNPDTCLPPQEITFIALPAKNAGDRSHHDEGHVKANHEDIL